VLQKENIAPLSYKKTWGNATGSVGIFNSIAINFTSSKLDLKAQKQASLLLHQILLCVPRLCYHTSITLVQMQI